MDSDSDGDETFALELVRDERRGGGTSESESEEEPPRRRMRMDEGVTPTPATMTLRSMVNQPGRSIQGQGQGVCSDTPLQVPVPVPNPALNINQRQLRGGRASEELAVIPQEPSVVLVDSSSEDEDENLSLHGSSLGFGSTGPPSMSPFYGSSPGGSSSVGGLTVRSQLSSASNTIDLDLDIDYDAQSVNSFESFNLDDLSDVPVVRSPAPDDSSSESSVDGVSLFGRLSENEAEGEAEVGEGNPGSWQHRRLQRRNAIVLENTDSQDSGAEYEVEEVGTGGISQFRLAVVGHAEVKRETTTSLPTAAPAPCTAEEDDSETSTCLICCELYTNSGEHRLCCLRCGHTYGKSCIEKWIKNESRCPQCNAKASKKDVRVLYVKNLKALDTAENDRLKMELQKEQEMKRKGELQ